MASPQNLSPKSEPILRGIAEGRIYRQIVDSNPEYTYPDLFLAAAEPVNSSPRVGKRWSPDEEERLKAMFESSMAPAAIARVLGRRPNGIRARLRKLGLLTD